MGLSVISRVVITGFSLLGVVLVVRTVYFSHAPHPVQGCKPTDADFIPLSDARLKHFQDALRFPTVSWEPGKYNREELKKFGEYIITNFPNIHKLSPHVEWERVNNYSLLYHIKGSNPNLKPYLLMSHLDVVPATEIDVWEASPFSGEIRNGFIYGRGTIDVKHCVMGILEATEYLLEHNQRPVRSFYISFGHDEELTGDDGAACIAKRLREKGVTNFEFIHDEGSAIFKDIIAGVQKPVASIGVTEKGQANFKLSMSTSSGHSSMPPKESSIGILSRAVTRLESSTFPSKLDYGVERDMFEHLAPEMDVLHRILVANIWLFKPVLSWLMSMSPATNSLIRTVTSVTIFNAGIKVNVIPPYAEAHVNHRIHPSQSVQEVLDYDKSIIADDRVKIETTYSKEPHPVSGYQDTNFGYQVLKTSIRQVWADVVVAPLSLFGNTDTRHFLNFSSSIYRFSPTFMLPEDPKRLHGNNERISVKNYEQVINFFYHVIRNSDQPHVTPMHPKHEDL